MGASSRWRLFMSCVSFERADTERTIAHGRAGWRCAGGSRFGGDRCGKGFHGFLGDVFKKCRRRHEEQVSGDGPAEIEQPVIVARWFADEHVLDHLLNCAGRTAVAYEICSKFTICRAAEGHVVAEYLDLSSVLDNRRECIVR